MTDISHQFISKNRTCIITYSQKISWKKKEKRTAHQKISWKKKEKRTEMSSDTSFAVLPGLLSVVAFK
jgi:hypothetical protein